MRSSRASFPVLPATVARLLYRRQPLPSMTTVTSNDAINVTIYNCRIRTASGKEDGHILLKAHVDADAHLPT